MGDHKQYFNVADLITKFWNGELSPDESDWLKDWIERNKHHQDLWQRVTDPNYLAEHAAFWDEEFPGLDWARMDEAIQVQERRRKRLRHRVMATAAVVLSLVLIGIVGARLLHQGEPVKRDIGATGSLVDVHIMPKGKVATLLLANGKSISLNDSIAQALTEYDGTKVNNQKNGLTYSSVSAGKGQDRALYNVLVTPRGGEYSVRLSDGTLVRLNAASSLRFPTQFTGDERKVYLSGEAYFEVSKDGNHPFVVNADNTNITVLGTRFNVSSYEDDPQQLTTLLSGSVRIDEMNANQRKDQGIILKPGYEAVVDRAHDGINIRKANLESALAWKNEMFVFNSESLINLMRKLSRWYDLQIVYDQRVDTMLHYTGRIPRYENITAVLNLLALTSQVKFSIKAHVLYVLPFK